MIIFNFRIVEIKFGTVCSLNNIHRFIETFKGIYLVKRYSQVFA